MGYKEWKKTKTESLKEKVSALKQKGEYEKDDRFYKAVMDQKTKEGASLVRFLPPKDEGMPIVRVFKHFIKKGEKFFVVDCPTTIGGKCPICEEAGKLFDKEKETGNAAYKDKAMKIYRKKSYMANVYILNDEVQPEYNGKTKIYQFGESIYTKLMNAFAPEDMDATPKDIFDIENGHNFKIKISEKEGWPNYDQSFIVEKTSELVDGNEEKLEEIFNSIINLDDFTTPDKFMDYDELKRKYEGFISGSNEVGTSIEEKDEPKRPGEKKQEKKSTEVKKEDIDFDDDEDDFDALLDDDDDDIPF